jgi:hypothetical protein
MAVLSLRSDLLLGARELSTNTGSRFPLLKARELFNILAAVMIITSIDQTNSHCVVRYPYKSPSPRVFPFSQRNLVHDRHSSKPSSKSDRQFAITLRIVAIKSRG